MSPLRRLQQTALIVISVGVIFSSCGKTIPSSDKMGNRVDSASYAIGMNIARRYVKDSIMLSPAMLYNGFRDAMEDSANVRLTDEEAQLVLQAFNNDLQARFMEKMSRQTIENEIKQREFLESNQQKEGVIARPTGLQYRILASGSGASPKEDDTCRVNYVARFLDGQEFDNSQMSGQESVMVIPAEMIAGWKEALVLMKPGDKWEVFVPSELAYGQSGNPQVNIPPNAMLIFEIELLKVKPKK